MIREHDRQTRVTSKLFFVVFCASTISASVGWSVWGVFGTFASLGVALAFVLGSNIRKIPILKAWSLGFCAFLLAISIWSELRSENMAKFEAALKNPSNGTEELTGKIVATRTSGFDLKILSINGTAFPGQAVVRIYAPLDRVSEGSSVRVTRGKRVVSKYSPYPTFRFERAERLSQSGLFTKIRERLGNIVEELYPRRESGLARGILF